MSTPPKKLKFHVGFSYTVFEENNELNVFVHTATLMISKEGGGKGTLVLAGELWGDKIQEVPVCQGNDITQLTENISGYNSPIFIHS